MKRVLHFHNILARSREGCSCRIRDLAIRERECCVLYGLDAALQDLLIRLATGASGSDQGVVRVLGTNAQECDEASWFSLVERIAVLDPASPMKEGASVGENLAVVLLRMDPLMEEPALSRNVLRISNLLKLTVADLATNLVDAAPVLRLKAGLGRALAQRPAVLFAKDSDLQPEAKRCLPGLLRRACRKLRLASVIFTSDGVLPLQWADRVIFLDPESGDFIENRFRRWYHWLFPFRGFGRRSPIQLPQDAPEQRPDRVAAGNRQLPGGCNGRIQENCNRE